MQKILFALFLVLWQPVTTAASAPAVELNDENFDSLVLLKKKEMWLVMFYAPWCGHCKHLKPVFDKASPKARSYGMRMGKMDATANSIVPKRYEVKGYPTLLYYRRNQPQKYKAGRSAEGFVEFAKVMKKPAVLQVANRHSLEAVTKKRPVTFFLGQPGQVDAQKTELYNAFHGAAFLLQDQFIHIGFASAGGEDDVVTKSKRFPTDKPYLVRLEVDEEPRYFPNVNDDELTEDRIVEWMEYERHQIFTPLTKQNFYLTSHSKQNAFLVVAIVDANNKAESKQIKHVAHELARTARPASGAVYNVESAPPTFLYGWLDGVEYNDFLEQYNIFESSLPQVVVFDAPTERHYHERDVSVPDGIEQFVKDVAAQKIYSKRQGFWGYLDASVRLFDESYPYSIGIVGSLVLMLLFCLVQCKRCICEECCGDDDDEQYEYKMKKDE